MHLPFSSKALSVTRNAKPFLKWVGGKHQLLSQFEKLFPKSFNRYFEPFLGGGAVFFHLWNTGRLAKQVFLIDNNEELINTYWVVRDNLEALVDLLANHKKNHNKDYYYQVRSLDKQSVRLNNVERAARTIYLNKTCYNGLYRVNSKKQFNVPIGSYKNPKILYKDVLVAASSALQNTSLQVNDFREVVNLAQANDFFYFDPPYDPVSKTANFTGYTANSFRDKDQQDLAGVFKDLTEKGCFCMLSNSYTPFILELYQDFRIELVDARRAVNSDGNGRGSITEIVVLNY